MGYPIRARAVVDHAHSALKVLDAGAGRGSSILADCASTTSLALVVVVDRLKEAHGRDSSLAMQHKYDDVSRAAIASSSS